MAKNNDAALDIDLTLEGDNWEPVRDDSGKSIRVSVSDGGIKFLAESDHEEGYDGCRWEDVNIDCESETLKELALYPGEPEAYCYIDSTEGEYLPRCGGSWGNTSNAGVFNVNLNNPRTNANGNIGFRSALLSYARTGQFKDCRQCERFKGVYFRSDRVEGEKWFYSCVGRAVPVETHKAGDTYGGRK